jgi:hypothetical protein
VFYAVVLLSNRNNWQWLNNAKASQQKFPQQGK